MRIDDRGREKLQRIGKSDESQPWHARVGSVTQLHQWHLFFSNLILFVVLLYQLFYILHQAFP